MSLYLFLPLLKFPLPLEINSRDEWVMLEKTPELALLGVRSKDEGG